MENKALARYARDSDEYECARLYNELCRYSMEKDGEGIKSICSEDYVLAHMTGMRQGRDEYIALMRSAPSRQCRTAAR